MTFQERTKDVYESIGGYPKPSLVSLPNIHNFDTWEQAGFKNCLFSRFSIKTVILLTGLGSFCMKLTQHLEEVLRKHNGRLPGLFAPVISATLVIKDDPACFSPTERAASLVIAARHFYHDLYAGKLEPDRHKDSILEMGQYPNLFSTCLKIDKKRVKMYKSKETSRINVALARKFYSMEMI